MDPTGAVTTLQTVACHAPSEPPAGVTVGDVLAGMEKNVDLTYHADIHEPFARVCEMVWLTRSVEESKAWVLRHG